MQSSWYRIELSSNDISRGSWANLQAEFEQVFLAAGGPAEMGMYCDTQLHEDPIVFYFSPACAPHCKSFFTKWSAVQSGGPRNAKKPIVGHAEG
jgi:hypothetical protein